MSDLLLIDDDQELCELLSSWLSQEGFQVRACVLRRRERPQRAGRVQP